MKNPQRIKNILRNIEVIWEKHPELRLGQLLINAIDEDILYHIDDMAIVRQLQEHYTYTNQLEKQGIGKYNMKKEFNELTEKEYNILKNMGLLWELYPDATDTYIQEEKENIEIPNWGWYD